MRGTGSSTAWASSFFGITPACAGNSFLQYFCGFIVGDHPRVCGEQIKQELIEQSRIGSPPRVRGTAYAHGRILAFFRITPACAGNRLSQEISNPNSKDHPRVCGEQVSCWGKLNRYRGSPPRVRGTVEPPRTLPRSGRITPACAGNSYFRPYGLLLEEDHPRVCGEQLR